MAIRNYKSILSIDANGANDPTERNRVNEHKAKILRLFSDINMHRQKGRDRKRKWKSIWNESP